MALKKETRSRELSKLSSVSRNISHNGFLPILHSVTNKPLMLWDKKIRNGYVKRITDNDIQNLVLEIAGNRLSSTYITCPKDTKKTLGIQFPYLNMTVKNMNRFFAFDVQVLDDRDVRRRFRISTFFGSPEVKAFSCKLPLILEEGWNQISFPLQDLIKKAYGTNYLETLRVQIYSNCRLCRVYFSEKYYSEEELPHEFRLYQPITNHRQLKPPSRM